MKKAYIKPESLVVLLNTETMIAQSGKINEDQTVPNNGEYYTPGARETVKSQDAWEEW